MSAKSPNCVDKHVGSRVRMRRMMLGMSQEKLGEALGLTFRQVQKYENGTNRVGASRIQQICEILQIPVSFLFEGSPTGVSKAERLSEAQSGSNTWFWFYVALQLTQNVPELDTEARGCHISFVSFIVVKLFPK